MARERESERERQRETERARDKQRNIEDKKQCEDNATIREVLDPHKGERERQKAREIMGI